MKRCLIVLLLILSISIIKTYDARESVKFYKCVDGDTARVIYNDEEIRIRMLAIDTPESVKENSEVEPYGKEASEYTCGKLKNAKKIEIEFDSKSDKQDKYDRYLVWVFLDDELFQEEILKNGLAKIRYVYDDYKYMEELYKSEEYAKTNKIALWSDEEYIKQEDNNFSNLIPLILVILSISLISYLISILRKR